MKTQFVNENCMLVSHPEVIPYFVRSVLLNHSSYFEDFTDNLKPFMTMPLEQFSKRVLARGLPAEFYSVAAAGIAARKEINCFPEFMGFFNHLICKKTDVHKTSGSKYMPKGTVYTLPLSQQSELFCPYRNDELGQELRSVLEQMEVDVPEDFPFRRYTGTLHGLMTSQTA